MAQQGEHRPGLSDLFDREQVGCIRRRGWVRQSERDQGVRSETSDQLHNSRHVRRENRELRIGLTDPSKRQRISPRPSARYRGDDRSDEHRIRLEPICEQSDRPFHTTNAGKETLRCSARSRRDTELSEAIGRVHEENYAAPARCGELHRQGERVARCTVERDAPGKPA